MLLVCKEAPTSIPELVLQAPANTRELLLKLADSALEGSETHKLLVAFDTLQTSTTWVQSWADTLSAGSIEDVISYIKKQTGMVKPEPKSDGLQKDPASALSKDGRHADADANSPATKAEHPANGSDDQTTAASETGMTLAQLEVFKDEKCIKAKAESSGLQIFDASPHAKSLDIENFSAAGLIRLQKGLEAVLWEMYIEHSRGSSSVLVDFGKARKDSVAVQLPVPSDLCFPYMGPISQNKGAKGLKICSLFGIDFYIHPCSENLQSAEVLVPAWSAKAVTKADQAYFNLATKNVPIWMTASSRDVSSVRFFLDNPTKTEKLADHVKVAEVNCGLQILLPMDDIVMKLEHDLKIRKDKAEKTVRNTINQSIRQSQLKSKKKGGKKETEASKAVPKPKRGGKRKGRCDDDDEVPEVADGQDADDDLLAPSRASAECLGSTLESLQKQAEESEAKIEKLVAEAIAGCQRPACIPITRLSSDCERVQSSTRALLMQNIMKEKQALEKSQAKLIAETESNEPMPGKLGAPAAMQAFNRDGVLQSKKKKGKTADSAAATAANNVMKMGKHVLK